jgi:hypothetical protein
MSIKIDNLANNSLQELTINDSIAVVGGTHKPLTLPKLSFPDLPGSASTNSFTAISPTSALTTQSALAIGLGTSITDTSAEASIDANGIRTKGGAVAIQTATAPRH